MTATWWVGTLDALEMAARSEGRSFDDVTLITEAALSADSVRSARWFGIERPPDGSHVFTLHAPIEASGDAEWGEYSPGLAPECELVAIRWAD